MTPIADAPKLADAIDPRRDGYNGLVERKDLIAASDLLRTLSAPLSGEAAELVKRLRHEADADAISEKRWLNEAAKLKREAIAEITRLTALVSTLTTERDMARALALSEAATIVRGEVYREHYRAWPQYHRNGGNVSAENQAVKICDVLANAIEALSPSPDLSVMVEKVIAAMRNEMKSRDVAIKHADGIKLSEIIAGDLERLARAVLSAIVGVK